MPKLTGTFWTFARSVNIYFVTDVSAEVRDTSAVWVGSRGVGGVGTLRSGTQVVFQNGGLVLQDHVLVLQHRDLVLTNGVLVLQN